MAPRPVTPSLCSVEAGRVITRKTNWPSRLEAEVRKRAATRFRWGYHDCCLAAVACVRAMTGADLAKGLRGYRTKAAAEAVIEARGGFLPMLQGLAAAHGLEAVAPAFAQRGDLAVWQAPHASGPFAGLQALGVVWLDGKHVFIAERVGWEQVRLKDCLCAWRVG